MATAKTLDQLDALTEELVDRFGSLPPATHLLLEIHRLRVIAKPYGVIKIDASSQSIQIHFKPEAPVDGALIIQLVQKNKHIKLAGNDKLRIEKSLPEAKERIQMVRDVLKALGSPIQSSPRKMLA